MKPFLFALFISVGSSVDFNFDLQTALNSTSRMSSNITSQISNWYRYRYDGSGTTRSTYINDGGNNMYDAGNYIKVTENYNLEYTVTYGSTINFVHAQFSSRAIYPFTALLKVENDEGASVSYKIRVWGSCSSTSAYYNHLSLRSITDGYYRMDYYVYYDYNAYRPSIIEVYFVLSSAQVWKSVRPSSFSKSFVSRGYNPDNTATISGRPSRVVFGYTLFSSYYSSRGQSVSSTYIANAMQKMIYALAGGDDECTFGTHNCHSKANCIDTQYSFRCECKPGYNGTGTSCSDIDECANNTHNCHPKATCSNTAGSFTCTCNGNMVGDGFSCQGFQTTCLPDSMSFRVGSGYYLKNGIGLGDLYLRDFKCQGNLEPSKNNSWIFNITSFEKCGTILTKNITHLTYTNSLMNWIYTGVGENISFSCSYPKDLDNVTLLSTSYKVVKNVVNLAAQSGAGVYTAELNRYTDAQYTDVDSRPEYETTDILYIMVRVYTINPTVNVVFRKCWVTPSANVLNPIRYVFINKSCPVAKRIGNVKITRSGQGPFATFESKVFAFINYSVVYLHCSLKICSPSAGETCIPSCLNNRTKRAVLREIFHVDERVRRDAQPEGEDEEIVSIGPLKLKHGDEGSSVLDLPIPIVISIIVGVVLIVISCLVLAGFYWLSGDRNQSKKKKEILCEGFESRAVQSPLLTNE